MSTVPPPPPAHGFRLKMDPIRFEVMRNTFAAAADEMGAALKKAAYSTNIKTRGDFSCALFDEDLRVIAQSFSQPIHLAAMARFVPEAIRYYGAEKLNPGDGVVMNHPHHGAMHLNDIAVIVPFFHEGKRAGYAATVAHHVDIGGMAPGGLSMSTDVYQEGIIIPSTLLIKDGKIVEDIFRLITANIRSPRQMAGDFRAQVAAALLGQRRIGEIIRRFGLDGVREFTGELIDYTRNWTKREISRLPEGKYHAEGYLDDDGMSDRPIKIVVSATVANGRIDFDLTGCDLERRSPMNANLTYSYSALCYVVKSLVSQDIPVNSGFYSQISVSAPKGTVANANPPCGVVGGAEVAIRICDLGFRALVPAAADKIPACGKSAMCQMGCGGIDPTTADYYTFYESIAGGYGARPDRDGMDAVQAHFQNTENSAIEEIESHYPLRVLRYELEPNSEGPGKYRGGLGVRRDWMFVDHEVTFTAFTNGGKIAPWGLMQGGEGGKAQVILNPGASAQLSLPTKGTVTLKAGSIVSYRTPGGGGCGPAFERDPKAVLRDVIQGKVSASRARTLYGVAVDEQTGTVDEAATSALRANP